MFIFDFYELLIDWYRPFNHSTKTWRDYQFMKMLTVFIPEEYFDALDLLVVEDRFPNRSEAIRSAIRDLVQNEYRLKNIIAEKKCANITVKKKGKQSPKNI
jgi:Arc/MetJ-type ribon-helix-helix transcriptional regulator